MKTSEILNKAADLIEERGWTQGTDGWPDLREPDRGPALCLEGGMMAALGRHYSDDVEPDPTRAFVLSHGKAVDDIRECPAYMAVRDYLDQHDENTPLCMWNDERGRTKEQVIEVLRAAAVIEQAKEAQLALDEAPKVAV